MTLAAMSVSAGLATSLEGAPGKYEAVNNRYIGYLEKRDTWQSIIGAAVAAYGLIKQSELLERSTAVAERAQNMAEAYLTLAQNAYSTIAVPTYTRLAALYDDSLSCFKMVQCLYLQETMRLKEYTPEYDVQMGRTIAIGQHQFDVAARQRSRAIGPYASGRCCDDATRFGIQRATAVAGLINHGYRYEEDKKRKLDAWYFDRQTQGAQFMTQWRGHIIQGLNGGAGIANAGLSSIGSAVNANTTASAGVSKAYGDSATFWSTVAGHGITMAGFDYGNNRTRGRSSQTAFGGGSSYSNLMGGSGGNAWSDSGIGGGVYSTEAEYGGVN